MACVNVESNEKTERGKPNEPKYNPPHSDYRIRLQSFQRFLCQQAGFFHHP